MQTIRELFLTFTKAIMAVFNLFRSTRKAKLMSETALAPEENKGREYVSYDSRRYGSRTGELVGIDNSGRFVINLGNGVTVRRQPHLITRRVKVITDVEVAA